MILLYSVPTCKSRLQNLESFLIYTKLNQSERKLEKNLNSVIVSVTVISYHVCVILCLTYFHVYSELKTRVSALESELAQAADESAEKVSVFEKKVV